jgi:hypothetical protein
MEVFVHKRNEEIRIVDVTETINVRELVEQVDGADGHVWLEEQDEEIDLEITLAEAEIGDRSHVHVGHCKRVNASVRYNGVAKEFEVSPASTLQSLFDRAVSKGVGFDLSESDRAEYTLQLSGTTEQPSLDEHVGRFVDDNCSVRFDLAKQSPNYQG